MILSDKVKTILSYYESDSPGTKSQICRLLMSGKLANTGHLVIYPIDQGFEHGPDRSFLKNSYAYDPHYHFALAQKVGVSALAAPLGFIESAANTYAGVFPLILKLNSSNSVGDEPVFDQAITGSVDEALRLGCSGIGFTIYPGSYYSLNMYEDIREIAQEAKRKGLFVVVWSYPRGSLSKEGETALDVVSYGAHIAALLGAHIIKVKCPSSYISNKTVKEGLKGNFEKLEDRIRHVCQCSFAQRRLVVFSGGGYQDEKNILNDIKAIKNGGGSGSILGRNAFQRSPEEAEKFLGKIIQIYLNK